MVIPPTFDFLYTGVEVVKAKYPIELNVDNRILNFGFVATDLVAQTPSSEIDSTASV